MSWRHGGLLILLGAIWGASFMFIKIGVSEMGPFTFAMLRVLTGASVLLLILLLNRQALPRDRRTWAVFTFLGAFNVLVPFGLIAWGEQSIPSGIAAILNATMPLFTLLLAAMFDSERITIGRILGLVVGFTGIFIITLPRLSAANQRASIWGELAVIIAVISYSVSTVFARRHTGHVNPLTASFGQIGMGFMFLFPFALSERPWTLSPSLKAIGAVLAIGIVGTAMAYLIYFRLVKEGGATLASLVTFISPLFGLVYGRVILNEELHWTVVVALACILASILLIRGAPRKVPIALQATLPPIHKD